MIIEFKQLRNPDVTNPVLLEGKLEQLAVDALTQIEEKKYIAEAKQQGVKNILIIDLVFSGKHFKLKSKKLTLLNR